jgi:ribosomal protein S18 acetylase RimI-like enzyme
MMILLQNMLKETGKRTTVRLPDGYHIRPSHPDDIVELGKLYFTAYDPDVGCATEEEAIDDIRKSFAGDYGELWLDASPVVTHDAAIVGLVQTVVSAPWPACPELVEWVPPGPYITECFVHREHRRLGLARTMLHSAMNTVTERGANSVTLRVMSINSPARLLYASLGFRQVK